jgi:hypothetical protein
MIGAAMRGAEGTRMIFVLVRRRAMGSERTPGCGQTPGSNSPHRDDFPHTRPPQVPEMTHLTERPSRVCLYSWG